MIMLCLIVLVPCLFIVMQLISSDLASLRLKKWVCGICCFLLALSVLLSAVIPKKGLAQQASPAVQLRSESHSADFTDLLNGNYDHSDNFYVNGKWEFPYAEKSLYLQIPPGTSSVLAQYKNEDDGIVDVVSCVSWSTACGCDITQQIKPPCVELSDNTLNVAEAPRYTIEKAKFTYDFTIQQFCRDTKAAAKDSINIGSSAVLIRLPKGMQVSSSCHIQFANQ